MRIFGNVLPIMIFPIFSLGIVLTPVPKLAAAQRENYPANSGRFDIAAYRQSLPAMFAQNGGRAKHHDGKHR